MYTAQEFDIYIYMRFSGFSLLSRSCYDLADDAIYFKANDLSNGKK